jgi:two-component system chemotaxis response regulator CheB
MQAEADMAELDLDALQRDHRPGTPSGFGCPDCGGSLFELREGDLVRFRCRVGHAWSPDSLLARQSEQLEEAFWTALRALEEKAALSRRLCVRAQERGHVQAAAAFNEQGREAEQQAALIRDVLLNKSAPAPPEAELNSAPKG